MFVGVAGCLEDICCQNWQIRR